MREKILQAMYFLVAEHGYDKCSLSQIAQAVSVQKSSLYHYFPSKEEIFVETVQVYYEEFYPLDLEKIEHCHSKEAFQRLYLDFGKALFQQFQEDITRQKFYSEANLQSQRIPALSQMFAKHDRNMEKNLTLFLKKGLELHALPENLDISLEITTILTHCIGLTEMVVYRMEGDHQGVWELYCRRLFT